MRPKLPSVMEKCTILEVWWNLVVHIQNQELTTAAELRSRDGDIADSSGHRITSPLDEVQYDFIWLWLWFYIASLCNIILRAFRVRCIDEFAYYHVWLSRTRSHNIVPPICCQFYLIFHFSQEWYCLNRLPYYLLSLIILLTNSFCLTSVGSVSRWYKGHLASNGVTPMGIDQEFVTSAKKIREF